MSDSNALAASDQDVIDLTEDLSEIGTPTPQLSSARKRPRSGSQLESVSDRRRKNNTPALVGEPFALRGREKYYRAINYRDLLIEVDSMITSDLGQALVRRIVERRRKSDHQTEVVCHVHWLQESACGIKGELFLKHRDCQNIRLNTIKSVKPIDIGRRGPIPGRPLLRHVFQHSYNVWRDPRLADDRSRPVCDSCSSHKKPQEESYHLHDFIFIEEKVVNPQIPSLVWRVAQIVQMDTASLKVQLFDRYSDWAKGKKAEFTSEKRLLLTQVHRRISLTDVLGPATLTKNSMPLNELHATLTPAFYCNERLGVNGNIIPLTKPLSTCVTCSKITSELDGAYKQFLRQVKLPAIDYYSGGGGGMIGAKGFFEHEHAVEMDHIACETLRENFRRAKVHCQKVGDASDAARLGGRGGLPVPGSMVLASAGPPCQGHSGANHQNKFEDSRNNELFVTINEIDRLRPDIFILENVPGMKRDRDGEGNEGAGNFAVEGIKRLRDIGYQVRMVQLDARSFGSPQNRIRLFFICARKGVPLPSIPVPSHANPELKVVNFFSASTSRRPFHVGSKGEPGSGPLPPITVRDAISDLPRFEYQYKDHPSPSPQIVKFDPLRKAGTRVGFLDPEPYRCPARNDFQARLRNGSTKVENHYTPPRTARILDLVFTSDAFVSDGTASKTPGNLRRINPDQGAMTLLTDSAPGGKTTGAIHYDQRRTLTVAERKRLQGVPDRYHICGKVEDKDRQVGNMINVDLSRALHGHIHRGVFFKAWLEMGRPLNFFERWRELHPI